MGLVLRWKFNYFKKPVLVREHSAKTSSCVKTFSLNAILSICTDIVYVYPSAMHPKHSEWKELYVINFYQLIVAVD